MAEAFQKPRILVVDDDPDFISDMTALLSSEFEVTSAANTVEARDSWKNKPPKCVLLDMNLPHYFADNPMYEGLAFLSHIKSQSSLFNADEIPVIAVTAGVVENYLKSVKQLGIAGIYNKPFDMKKLKTCIWSLIGERGEVDRETQN